MREPIYYQGNIIPVSLVIGQNMIGKDKSFIDLYEEVDQAMYQNKTSSR